MANTFNVNPRAVDFASTFSKSWKALTDVMGIMRPVKKTPGTTLKSYTATIDLDDSTVAPSEVIPMSPVTITEVAHSDVSFTKRGKEITIEEVDSYGADIAIEKSDEAFKNAIVGEVLTTFYNFLATGQLTATSTSFKAAIAKAIGSVKNKFQQLRLDGSSVIVWVNTTDAYDYLGAADITVQNAFGMNYIENFMGADRIILSSDIASGTVIATPTSNIVNYYADPSQSDYAKLGLRYEADPDLPIVGFAVDGDYSDATGKSYAVFANVLWAEYLDAIAVVTVAGE